MFGRTRRGRATDRWAGHPLMEALGVSEAVASMMIDAWVRNRVLELVTYRDPAQRRDRTGLRVVDERRPGRVPVRHNDEGAAHDAAN